MGFNLKLDIYYKNCGMGNLFIVNSIEKERILEMHKSTPTIVEQTAKVLSPNSTKAREFIVKTFGLGKYSPTKTTTAEGLKTAKSALKKYDMNKMAQMAREAGVTQEDVKALQEDLVKIAGYPLKFQNTKGESQNFVDGNLGTNTVDAYLDYQLKLLTFKRSAQAPIKTEPVDTIGGIKSTYNRL